MPLRRFPKRPRNRQNIRNDSGSEAGERTFVTAPPAPRAPRQASGSRHACSKGVTARKQEVLEVAGRHVTVTNPDKIYFPRAGHSKLDLIRYYLAVRDGALRGVAGRPMVLRRYPDGAEGKSFFQKRAPKSRPAWIETITIRFPSGRSAEEIVVRDAAHLVWVVNTGCLDLNPHPVTTADLDHPDELRIDLDPGPGVDWDQLRKVALIAREALADHDLRGFPKTSGSRGMHINVRIHPRYPFSQVRRAALALARDVERRAPSLATSAWWKEERQGVFLDYNQNARDRTVASAYSVRPTPDARVSAPLSWDEVPACDPADFTLKTVPRRYASAGDPADGISAPDAIGSLEALLELAARHEAEGRGDAPWPPHYKKQDGEPPRVAPSRQKRGRVPRAPLITIARAADESHARAGLERWKARHPEAAAHLEARDVLVDAMRGRYSTWTRIRINLERVPEPLRPPDEPADPDDPPS